MNEHTCLKGRCQEGGARLLSEGPDASTRGSSHKGKSPGIHVTITKDVFPCEGHPALTQVAS